MKTLACLKTKGVLLRSNACHSGITSWAKKSVFHQLRGGEDQCYPRGGNKTDCCLEVRGQGSNSYQGLIPETGLGERIKKDSAIL